MKTNFLLLMLLLCSSLSLYGQIRITEYMYSSNNAGATGPGEFVELTNVGSTAVNLTGWSFDDNSRAPGSFPLSSFGIVQPRESVIITDATAAEFQAFWSLPNTVKVLGGNNQNLARNDEINIFNGSALVDRLTYGDETIPGSIRTQFRSGWTTRANLGMNNISGWVLSSVGDVHSSTVATTNDIGNPGRYIIPVDCTNPPSIRVANFVNLPTVGPGDVSGVIGDPTDPARTSGINFQLADPDTPVNSLIVSASSTNANVTLNLAGTGDFRNLKITPTAVGYATVTVSVTDGNCTVSYLLNYAASAASVTQNTTRSRFHTGTSDASTAVLLDDTSSMLVADDENQVLRLYVRDNSGEPYKSVDYTSSLQLTDVNNNDVIREVDIEASIRQNNRIFWFGSQSDNDEGEVRPNRNRVFATDFFGNLTNPTLTYVGRYDHLKNDILNWDLNNGHGKGANYYGLQASAAPGVNSKSSAGYNIEGAELAPDGTTAYIGFRAPLVPPTNRQKALIIPVTNLTSLINNQPPGSATFGPPIELDLGGRGIREIRKNSANQYVILAGPAGDATGTAPNDFRLYTWTGNASDRPLERNTNLTVLNANGSFESIVEVPNPLTNTSQLQLLVDNGDAVYYNDGIIAKELAQNNFKKFRSDLVTLGAPVNTPPTVANALENQVGRVNQPFSYTVLASTFTDAETPDALALRVTNLPTGLSFTNGIISGIPSVSGIAMVRVTATDPGGLSVSTGFTITVEPAPLLVILAPTYDCRNGELTIHTIEGDGTPIEYMIGGVPPTPNWTLDSTFVLPQAMRNDPNLSSLTLMVRQSGRVFTFLFNLRDANKFSVVKPTYDCNSGLLIFNTNSCTGALIEYMIPGVVSFNLDRSVVVPLWIRTDPNAQPLQLTARQGGQEDIYEFNITNECDVMGELEVLAPTYNCTTGALTFNTRGGNNTAIEYMISGLTTFSSNPNFIVPAAIRRLGRPLTLTVRQSGVITSVEFDIRDFCSPAPFLEVVAPIYICLTGGLAINVQGGNGSRIEYSIPGVRGWSTNPNFGVPLWIRTDVNRDPLILFARQSGVISSYVFDINSFCAQSPGPISLLAPGYDCASGALSFNVSTENGSSPIEYMISGVTGWSKKSTLVVPVRFRSSPELVLLVRQSGITDSYIFELKEFCGGGVLPSSMTLIEPSYICNTGQLSVHISGGNGSQTEYMIPGVRGWSTNPNFVVSAAIRNDPNSQPLLLFARQSGNTVSSTFDFREYCEIRFPFEMLAPNYVCQTGRLTLFTTPGTGTKIEYMIPGVRGYSRNPNFIIPAAIRNNPNSQPLRLFARQNGVVEDDIFFDFREFCRTGTFRVVPPTYACATGRLTINTSGGDGSLIEYMIPGIRGWSRNRNFIIPAALRNNANSQPLNLIARQGGVLTNMVFNFRSFCGTTARQGVEVLRDRREDWQLQVLGNPVQDEAVVEIHAAVGQSLTIRLFDVSGRLVDTKSIQQAREIERVLFDVSQQQAGILILQVMTARQVKAVRLLKQ